MQQGDKKIWRIGQNSFRGILNLFRENCYAKERSNTSTMTDRKLQVTKINQKVPKSLSTYDLHFLNLKH
jgi:hypothetical protein